MNGACLCSLAIGLVFGGNEGASADSGRRVVVRATVEDGNIDMVVDR